MNIILCGNCNNPVFVLSNEINHKCPNCEFIINVKESIKTHTGEK